MQPHNPPIIRHVANHKSLISRCSISSSQFSALLTPAHTPFANFEHSYQPEQHPSGNSHSAGFVAPFRPSPSSSIGFINIPNTTRDAATSAIPADMRNDTEVSHSIVSSNLGGFDLCMHKGDSKTVPSYGRGESVSGYADLKVFDHIAEIEVTGTLQVVYTERGVVYKKANLTLLTETRTLFTSAWGRAPGQFHQFAFEFPKKYVASDTALPPTWSLTRAGVSAEVLYIIWATLKRKGLFRRDDKASTKVEYYPRTGPPLPGPVSPNGRRKPNFHVFEMEHYLRPTSPSPVNRPMIPTTARISLRLPLTYASGSKVPYTVTLSSHVGTSVLGYFDVQVSLIRTSKLLVQKIRYETKDVVAQGINVDKEFESGDRRGNTNSYKTNEVSTVTITGMIVAGGVGHEMSWGVEGVATIMYALRFVVTPIPQASEFTYFGDTLPTFEHLVEIMLTTDSQTTILLSDAEARLPARDIGHGRTRSNTNATGRPR